METRTRSTGESVEGLGLTVSGKENKEEGVQPEIKQTLPGLSLGKALGGCPLVREWVSLFSKTRHLQEISVSDLEYHRLRTHA